MLRRDDGHVLGKAFEVRGKRKQGRPKKIWKTQVEKGAMNQARWRVGVREIAAGVNPSHPR